MSNWVNMETFNTTHNLHTNTMYVMKSEGIMPNTAWKKEQGKVYIDERFFRKRKEFKARARLFSHDVYYYLNEHFNDSEITRLMILYDPSIVFNAMYTFIKVDLFISDTKTIVTQKLTKNQWKFFKFARFFMRKMRVYLTKVPVNLDMILDNRMTNEYLDKKIFEGVKK